MPKKRGHTFLLSLLMLAGLGCGFVTGFSSTPAPIIILPAPAPSNSAQALQNVAKILYDAAAAGQDLKPYLTGVMTAFGVPPLGPTDAPLAGTRYSQGQPLMFAPQIAEMADAFNDGGFVGLDAFIAAANDQGAKQRGTGEPLTRDYLTQKFADYTGNVQYQPGQVLPAFVLALGKERASRFSPQGPDPVWGDGLLDPLQLTLLLYAVSYSGAGPLASRVPLPTALVRQDMNASFAMEQIQAPLIAGLAASDPIGDYIKEEIRDRVAGQVQDFVEVPLDKVEAAQVSVCASLLLYGHKIRVTTTPRTIYHKDGSHPWSTRVDALLTFEDDYWSNYLPIDRWMLENLGNCKLPHQGPVEGKPLEWSVSDGLMGHGSYNITPAATDGNGKASANWQTVPETTPQAQRIFANQRDAVGAAIVRAGSLVPGWSGLERIVGALKDTGNTGDSPITVIYYIGGSYKADWHDQGTDWSGVVCGLDRPFNIKVLSAGSPRLELPFKFVPNSSQGGSVSYDVAAFGTHWTGSGTYVVQGSGSEKVSIDGQIQDGCATAPAGQVCKGFPFHLDLTPLATAECSQP